MKRTRRTLLWVEDDPFVLSDYKTLLEDQRYVVIGATSVKEAKTALRNRRGAVDLAIVDVRMKVDNKVPTNDSDSELTKGGHESGLVLARWIRQRYPRVRIVGFSAYANDETRRWFEDYCNGFRSKSETFNTVGELTNWIEKAINPRRCTKVSRRVFIVHGQDEKAKYELKNYLQNTLNMGMPMILHEQPSLGRTLIEKFEEEAQDVDLGVCSFDA